MEDSHIVDLPYQTGYSAPPPPPPSEETIIDIRYYQALHCYLVTHHILFTASLFVPKFVALELRIFRKQPLYLHEVVVSGGWTVVGTQLDLNDPRLLSMAITKRHLQEANHDEYVDASASGAAFCHSAALFLMALLLLRHAFENSEGDDEDVSVFFSLFLLRAAGFLLPCFIMAWGISILQRRRQRQL
ncbi:hypothetical protein H5410_061376 [Solanum commersonii]|uniref:Uncharacterized protein n=1 Tax=Solanum commersonii TaxID=4109 RepID=A0A9J5W7U0_SOLCO|nr:hypothetical protein H5410_061376 [Solanum commersonii]